MADKISRLSEPPTRGKVLLHTTIGDLDVELFADQAPLACRNFVKLGMEGYFDGCQVTRVVPGVWIETGDATNQGTGGRSIYKGSEGGGGLPDTFRDEVHSRVRMTGRGYLAMQPSKALVRHTLLSAKQRASHRLGPHDRNCHRSQFIVTLDACAFLDQWVTVFGKVTGGTVYNLDRLTRLELDVSSDSETEDKPRRGRQRTGRAGRPLHPPRITGFQVLTQPFADLKVGGEVVRGKVGVCEEGSHGAEQKTDKKLKKKKKKKKHGKRSKTTGGGQGSLAAHRFSRNEEYSDEEEEFSVIGKLGSVHDVLPAAGSGFSTAAGRGSSKQGRGADGEGTGSSSIIGAGSDVNVRAHRDQLTKVAPRAEGGGGGRDGGRAQGDSTAISTSYSPAGAGQAETNPSSLTPSSTPTDRQNVRRKIAQLTAELQARPSHAMTPAPSHSVVGCMDVGKYSVGAGGGGGDRDVGTVVSEAAFPSLPSHQGSQPQPSRGRELYVPVKAKRGREQLDRADEPKGLRKKRRVRSQETMSMLARFMARMNGEGAVGGAGGGESTLGEVSLTFKRHILDKPVASSDGPDLTLAPRSTMIRDMQHDAYTVIDESDERRGRRGDNRRSDERRSRGADNTRRERRR